MFYPSLDKGKNKCHINNMVTPELLSYIKTSLQKSTPKEMIINTLLGQGWTLADIDEAFLTINPPLQPPPPSFTPAPPPITPSFNTTSNFEASKGSFLRSFSTVFFLIFLYPIGLIFAFALSRWPTWVKVVTSIVFLIIDIFIAFFAIGLLIALNPQKVLENVEQATKNITGIPTMTNDLKEQFQQSFIPACEKSAGTNTNNNPAVHQMCVCMGKYLIDNYSVNEILIMAAKVKTAKETPAEITKATNYCLTTLATPTPTP